MKKKQQQKTKQNKKKNLFFTEINYIPNKDKIVLCQPIIFKLWPGTNKFNSDSKGC